MNKFLLFCKKPLLIIASVVFGVFTLGLIITSVVPYARTAYTYSITMMGQKANNTIELGEKMTIKTYVNGNLEESSTMFYKVESGKLYVGETEDDLNSEENVAIAQINPYEIRAIDGLIVYKNGFTNAMKIIDIIFMVISGLALAGSITLIVLDKKGKLKSKKVTEQVTNE